MLNLPFIRKFHEAVVVPTLKAFISNRETRNRLLGGAAITSLVLVGLQIGLTVAFLWAHDIFDAEFAANHFLALVATATLISALAFFGAWLIALRAQVSLIETTLERQDGVSEDSNAEPRERKFNRAKSFLDRIFLRIFRWFIVIAVVTTVWPIFKAMWAGDTALIVAGVAIVLVALVLAIRWYVHDAVVSNYLTGMFGVASVCLIASFPYHAAVLYQQLALRPFGVSGVKVHVSSEDNELDACLVLLSQSSVWLRTDSAVMSIPRDKATITFDVRRPRQNRNCSTIFTFGEDH